MVQNAGNGISSMFLIIVLGYFIAGTSIFRENNGGTLISKYLTRVALPVYMLYNTVISFSSRKELLGILHILPVPFLIILGEMLTGLLLARLFAIQSNRRGVFVNACSLGNIVFLGFPITQAILGAGVIPTAMTYYTANTFLFWTLGVYLLRKDSNQKMGVFTISNVKSLFSPPLVGFLLGIFCVLMEIHFPVFLMSSMDTISKTCSGLGMIFIGSIIREANLKDSKFIRDIAILLPLKFLVFPFAILGLLLIAPLPLLTKQVCYIMTLMPGMNQLGLMSKEWGSDYKFASVWVALSTVICVITIPLLVWLMTAVII